MEKPKELQQDPTVGYEDNDEDYYYYYEDRLECGCCACCGCDGHEPDEDGLNVEIED